MPQSATRSSRGARPRHLQALQGEDGWFAARYDPETGSVPDDRAPQLDAVGLVLWSIAEVAAASEPESPAPAPARSLSELEPMIDRSTAPLDELTGGGRTLPPVSPDYWEVGGGPDHPRHRRAHPHRTPRSHLAR
ncbi:hypothetical protein IOD13_06075 [Brevibacterium casei]|nr:hypothetical protein [Brevibacterium casei]